MTDFLAEVLSAGHAVVERQVSIGGRVGTVHLRRLSAGERLTILKGQKVSRESGEMKFEIDLALNEAQQHQMVAFCVVKPDGTPYFKNVEAVRSADTITVAALYQACQELHEPKEEDEPGKG